MSYYADENGNDGEANLIDEKDLAIALYNIGVRGQHLEILLAIAYGENGAPDGWNSGKIALNAVNPDGEDSWGAFQLNHAPGNAEAGEMDYLWQHLYGPGYESKAQAFNTLEGNIKGLALYLSNYNGGRLRTTGKAIEQNLDQIFARKNGGWSAYKPKTSNWDSRMTRAYDVADSVLPRGWNTDEPRWDTFREKMWTDAVIVGEDLANIGQVQLMGGIDVDNDPGKNTKKIAEQDENGFWRLKTERAGQVDPNISGQFPSVDWPPVTRVGTNEAISYQTMGRPVIWNDLGEIVEGDTTPTGSPVSFQDADAAGLDTTETPPITGGNPPGFDPWPFVDAPPNIPGQPGIGGVEGDFGPQAGSLGFLRGRADARIFDPKTGQEYDFVEFMEHQLRGETDPDRIALWIDTWLPKTAWFQNTPATVRGRISEWFSEGMGAEEEDWTGARRGRVQPYYDTLLDLIQREGFEADQAVVWDVAKLGYLYDWDEDKFIRYFSGETVDGETNVQGDVFFEGPTSAAGNIANIKSTMRTSANTYVISMSAPEERALAKRIFTGEVPIANVDNIFREKARLLYPYLADFYDAGGTTTEFLDQFDPVMQRMLGRSGEWTGRDYSVGQAALTGDLTDLHYYMYRGGNTMDEVMMGDPETPGSYVPRDPFGRPNQVTAKQDRPLSVQEFKLALKRTEEYQQGGYALAEMGQLLNLLGSGMGAAP